MREYLLLLPILFIIHDMEEIIGFGWFFRNNPDIFERFPKITKAYTIEDDEVLKAVNNADMIVFSYPVQFSTVPKIMRDFVTDNKELWRNKKVFVIATMGLFSGDGSGMLGRLLENYGAEVLGGLHLKMPDSIADEKVLKD